MEDGIVVNKVSHWTNELGVNYKATFAMYGGQVECVRIEIGALANPDGTMPKIGERLREAPHLIRPLRSADLNHFGLDSKVANAHRSWAQFLEEIIESPEFPQAFKDEARRMQPLARNATRRSHPGPPSMTREEAEERAGTYLEAEKAGKDPIMTLANRYKVHPSTARRWVKELKEVFDLIPGED